MKTIQRVGPAVLSTSVMLLALAPALSGQVLEEEQRAAAAQQFRAVAQQAKVAAQAVAQRAQQQSEVPDSLEVMLAKALKSNPDVLLAEAKVREAQAQLNLARLKVTQDVVGLFHQRKSLRTVKEAFEIGVKDAKMRYSSGTSTQSAITEALIAQANASANLAKIEAALQYSLGSGAAGDPTLNTAAIGPLVADEGSARARPPSAKRPDMPADVREKLMEKADFDWEEASLRDVLDQLQEISGLSFVISAGLVEYVDEQTVNIRLSSVTRHAALQALADQCEGEICFVFRAYGVLVTSPDAAEFINAPTVPGEMPLAPPR